jgi:hypothetical protein
MGRYPPARKLWGGPSLHSPPHVECRSTLAADEALSISRSDYRSYTLRAIFVQARIYVQRYPME